jgi:hypothetical protein
VEADFHSDQDCKLTSYSSNGVMRRSQIDDQDDQDVGNNIK